MNSCIPVYPFMHISMYMCKCEYVHIHGHIYTCTRTITNMDTHIYETMRYSMYCLKFHPSKINTYRLTYCFPLHLFSKILPLVFTELFNKLGLFLYFFGISFHCLKPRKNSEETPTVVGYD